MKNLRWGLMTTSLSVGMILGGSALAQTAQHPQEPPAATSPAQTAPDTTSKPMSEQPNMSAPQDNQQVTPQSQDSQQVSPQQQQPVDRDSTSATPQDRDHDSTAKPQDRDRDNMGRKDNDQLNRKQVAAFDKFLNKHPEVAEELRKDPSKINDASWVSSHKDLANFLDKHPQIREELKENPSAVMNRENRYDKNENKPANTTNPSVPQ